VTGIGLLNNVVYHATGVTRYDEHFKDLPYEYTAINNFKIIGEGQAENLLVHQTVHITVNANGEMTVDVEKTSLECRG
jgi:hypothetical protein